MDDRPGTNSIHNYIRLIEYFAKEKGFKVLKLTKLAKKHNFSEPSRSREVKTGDKTF